MIRAICAVLCLSMLNAPIFADTIRGENLALKSSGQASPGGWTLSQNGFVGTFVQLDTPGEMAITLDASGVGANSPRVNVVIGDAKASFEIASAVSRYEHDFALPAGTHFVRVELVSRAANPDQTVTIQDLSIRRGRILNELTDANALAVSETYINNFRKSEATVRLPDVAPGTPVQIKLVRKEFNFGTNAPGTDNIYLIDNPPADSDAARFQKFIIDHFNMIVPSNAGKWIFHEPSPGVVSMDYADAIMRFAKVHHIRGRMHTLLWDHVQQPPWVIELLDRAVAGDQEAKKQLRQAISNRIKYYVRDRATNYVELDVHNESLHQEKYWKVFGAAGIANIFKEVQQAAKESGANPPPLLMTNEFNVLQWSRPVPSKGEVFDPYANWYRAHVEELIAAGAPVSVIGVQYNVDCRPEAQEKSPHSAARIFCALQNLSVPGLPITLTEFQIAPDATPQQAARIYYELMRLLYGSPQVKSFLIWGFWAGNTPDLAVLANKDWTLTPAGRLYERLMKGWTTNVKAIVSSDRTISFTGHFGECEIIAGETTYRVTIAKGIQQYEAK
ncbi:hypothetical protein BH09PLA1_BH09PLA1_12120 [soil metagenome]